MPPVLIASPPALPPQVIAGRFDWGLDTDQCPVLLHPVTAVSRPRFSADYAEGRTLDDCCDTAGEVPAVLATDIAYRVLPIDEHRPPATQEIPSSCARTDSSSCCRTPTRSSGVTATDHHAATTLEWT